jgi:hypothetical protein
MVEVVLLDNGCEFDYSLNEFVEKVTVARKGNAAPAIEFDCVCHRSFVILFAFLWNAREMNREAKSWIATCIYQRKKEENE